VQEEEEEEEEERGRGAGKEGGLHKGGEAAKGQLPASDLFLTLKPKNTINMNSG
jgi:hypothetical protein